LGSPNGNREAGFPFEGFLRVENPVIAKNGNRESGFPNETT